MGSSLMPTDNHFTIFSWLSTIFKEQERLSQKSRVDTEVDLLKDFSVGFHTAQF